MMDYKQKPQQHQTSLYDNCQTSRQELEDVFNHSEILYLVQYKNNKDSNQPKNHMEILIKMNKLINNHSSSQTVNHEELKSICLNLWFYCMGWIKYNENEDDDLLQRIDTNCNKLFNFMVENDNINLFMKLLKICLLQHKQSIDELSEESQGVILFNEIYHQKPTSNDQESKSQINDKISNFWTTFEIINTCMNSILCIAWSQRNNPAIKNNALFIEYFHIDKEPLFVHLFNYIAQENYAERMPIKKFIIYIKWHLFFSNDTGKQLNQITNTLKNKSKPHLNQQKCTIHDFFQIANEIDTNYTPLLILPPSVDDYQQQISKKTSSGGSKLANAQSMIKNLIATTQATLENDDEKYTEMERVKYERPSYLDYRYPIYKLPERFQFETAAPRIELFGKDIVPKPLLNTLENCHKSLPKRGVQRYNLFACDIYKYLAIKSRVPDWILMEQNKYKPLNNKKDSSPKWLQNIRMGLGMKMFVKLLCSSMPSSYKRKPNLDIRVQHIPDIRYEVVASNFSASRENDLDYYHQLRRYQDILSFNILCILLGLLKIFKTHEILQSEDLKYLLLKDNAIIVLCKLFNHPYSTFDKHRDNPLLITRPQTYINYNIQQIIDKIYGNRTYDDHNHSNNMLSPKALTIKINALRIIQKCVKYSYGHCRVLCHVLKCHEWLIKYINHNDQVLRYYVLKLYKSMMPFLSKEWKQQSISIEIIEMIKNNVRIGMNDQWLSHSINDAFNDTLSKYKQKLEEPQKLKLDPYYQWLGLKELSEKDYAETCFNPFHVKHGYGVPRLEMIAPKKWSELMDEACTDYHEWFFSQIKSDDREFMKQKKYIGMSRHQMEKQKMIDRSNRVDAELAKIKVPDDFDFSEYLQAYFNGQEDELLNKIRST